jgi:pyridoxamine 5'-phosphate oxidase
MPPPSIPDPERLAAMRREYARAGLDEGDLAPTWLEQLRRWVADAVAARLREPNAMVISTATPDGAPSARTVLLKGLGEDGLTFFTNLRSRKGRELAANPRAAAVLPWFDLQRQVVVTGAVTPVPAEESDAYFASRPYGSRVGAAASPQSEVIASRAELERTRDELVACHPEGTDVPRPEHWGGLRLAPETVEFWQGRPDRLHDREHFLLQDDGSWRAERLSP